MRETEALSGRRLADAREEGAGVPAREVPQARMFAIIGIIVVFGAVVAGYLMEHGHLAVLVQPAELLIIGGAGGAGGPAPVPIGAAPRVVTFLGLWASTTVSPFR